MGVLEELERFYARYAGIKGYIGCTGRGTPILFFAVEKTEYPVIIAQYAIHAREHITTRLALKQIERYYRTGKAGTVVEKGKKVQEKFMGTLFENTDEEGKENFIKTLTIISHNIDLVIKEERTDGV